jgi:hyperosmotically inducible protein
MRSKFLVAVTAMVLLGAMIGCSQQRANPPVQENVEQALQQSGMGNISVDENREQGVITLQGEVQTDAEKQQAEQMARQAAPGRVIANEIAVRPAGEAGERAEDVQGNLDDAIESHLKAEMAKMPERDVSFDVNNGVVTLKGNVASQQQRTAMEKMAAAVPGVQQVVNQIEIGNREQTPATARD